MNDYTDGTSTTNGSSAQPLPIVIAGGGCVGLFLALLLSTSKPSIPNKVIVIEPESPDPTSTRAMAHQPPTYPILSKVPGLLPELIAKGSLSGGLCFRTSVANGSRVIAGKTFDNASGEGMKGKGQLLLPQGKFQEVLLQRLHLLPENGEVRLGSRVTSFAQSAESVIVQVQTPTGSTESIEAAYLIGADGAHSTIHKHLSIPFDGETLDVQLVATDIRFDFHAHGFLDANFVIDPIDYGLIGRIESRKSTQPALWRVSYGVPVSMSEDTIRAGVNEKLRKILPNEGNSENREKAFEVVRVAPYKAQQRCAETFWMGRVGLVGDAAHLTNPYAGLGLASGIADASSLSEVLAHILNNEASNEAKLLASWSEARRQKFTQVVDKPSRMAYARVMSDVSTPDKVESLLSRDPLVSALKEGMPMMPPSLETKGLELAGW
ncbi:hypothetical protein BKA66DRAFT_515258 [Pyrenochaeta sp. MPI-SDFR-AT-0127]|nr:hypothetical protein BKA66DRAFT_515258 [Pyrenochaeta sp. MPI-SDFR-AT-0127]